MGCSESTMLGAHHHHTHPEILSQVDKNHFISTGILGEGGFGTVVAAMFVKNGSWYAVKEINKFELVKHKAGVSMIFGELAAMKKVDHPFVINLQLAFQDRRYCFLVLDLKTGGDLRYYLRKRYLFDERDCAFYVACLSSALDYIHSKNIIHRDVKPENIIFDERGYPYLTDFGVAHVQNDPWDKTLTCNLASGTKQYLAPEVFTKSHVHGPEVDFWSLGVVIYEVLFGRRPFDKHCPIPFIQYLEKALSLKRKQLKELKMRELAHQSLDFTANSTCPLQISLPTPNGLNSARASLDFTTRASFTTTNYDNGSSNKFVSKLPGFHSPLKTAQSTDFSTYDKDSAPSTGLMNSASPIPEQNKRGLLHHGLNNSYQEISLSSSESNQKSKSSLDRTDSNTSSPHKKRSILGKESSSLGSTSFLRFLPELKPTGSNQSTSTNNNNPSQQQQQPQPSSTTRNIFKRNPSIHPSGDNRCVRGSTSMYQLDENQPSPTHPKSTKNQQQQPQHFFPVADNHNNEEDDQDKDQENFDPENYRAIPGDHWLVDEIDLPTSLCVQIPQTNPWLGILSDECIELLSGLFDVRPSHRYGGRNIHKIRQSNWLGNFNLTNWDKLADKKYCPRFQPGKRFLKDTLTRLDDISQARLLGCSTRSFHDPPEEVDPSTYNLEDYELISEEQEELFKDFIFIGRQYSEVYSLPMTYAPLGLSSPLTTTVTTSKLNEILPSKPTQKEKLSC